MRKQKQKQKQTQLPFQPFPNHPGLKLWMAFTFRKFYMNTA